ncbi:MAG: pseudouridine synthase, partial [Longicatena sp.]|nr:pseudouridine synthase [Longicatena sp.]
DMTIYEGRYHQVKRMMEALGYKVRRLHRTRLAFLKVNDLSQGEYRRLKPFEVQQLKAIALNGKMKNK